MAVSGTYYVTYLDRSPYDTLSAVTDISKVNEPAMEFGRNYRDNFSSSSSNMGSGPYLEVLPPALGAALTYDDASQAVIVPTTAAPASVDVVAQTGLGAAKSAVYLPDNVSHVPPRATTNNVDYISFTITGGPAGSWKLRIPASIIRSIVNEQPASQI